MRKGGRAGWKRKGEGREGGRRGRGREGCKGRGREARRGGGVGAVGGGVGALGGGGEIGRHNNKRAHFLCYKSLAWSTNLNAPSTQTFKHLLYMHLRSDEGHV